jgi:hypothetical protein
MMLLQTALSLAHPVRTQSALTEKPVLRLRLADHLQSHQSQHLIQTLPKAVIQLWQLTRLTTQQTHKPKSMQ